MDRLCQLDNTFDYSAFEHGVSSDVYPWTWSTLSPEQRDGLRRTRSHKFDILLHRDTVILVLMLTDEEYVFQH